MLRQAFRMVFAKVPTVLPWAVIIGWLLWNLTSAVIPVTVFLTAENWKIEADAVEAEVTGYKVRDCPYIKDSAAGYAEYRDIWHHVHFEFIFDKEGQVSRPLGHHSFGVWKWQDDIVGTPSRVMATVQHMCSGTIVTTTFGPFVVSG